VLVSNGSPSTRHQGIKDLRRASIGATGVESATTATGEQKNDKRGSQAPLRQKERPFVI
jgi:hypothetical protein